MHFEDLKKEHKVFDIFCNLVKIPSPSLSEDALIDWIESFLKENCIDCSLDNYKNVIIKVPPTNNAKKPILLSAHMDVVGDSSEINLEYAQGFIQTDKKRTLGADDKAGVACALLLAVEIAESKTNHGGLEIVLTRDEERGMSGIKNLDFSQLESKYALVLDSDKLGQILVSGAGYTIATLDVSAKIGGHSGLDIADEKRLNAAKLIAEIINNIPQGVYYANKTGVITSINIGTIIAGNIQNSAARILSDQLNLDNYQNYLMENAITNIINPNAQAVYSIRSADKAKETDLRNKILNIIDEFNNKYSGLASAEVKFIEHLPIFEQSEDDLLTKIHSLACAKTNISQQISSFHAGAETHIYSQNSNKFGEKFNPVLFGVADIYNMHSCEEKINKETLLSGYNLLKEFFNEYNS